MVGHPNKLQQSWCVQYKMQMPKKSINEEYKVTKARQVMMIRDSGDEKVREAGVAVDTGRKLKRQSHVYDKATL